MYPATMAAVKKSVKVTNGSGVARVATVPDKISAGRPDGHRAKCVDTVRDDTLTSSARPPSRKQSSSGGLPHSELSPPSRACLTPSQWCLLGCFPTTRYCRQASSAASAGESRRRETMPGDSEQEEGTRKTTEGIVAKKKR
ncbi:hypothetical protein HPB50_015603 [Hyalomma asiaticum]|uniref:Uncharacterized protein n=1 Tax=Hyalomma asiaticum TaxID=266040 RepID=A0ACB7SWM2_HYAAI|nr:hypothetical protein HPB50_015603 [Hyalomma asiaticum]